MRQHLRFLCVEFLPPERLGVFLLWLIFLDVFIRGACLLLQRKRCFLIAVFLFF